MRSVANSRERWATVIESVLRITNAPTNSAMPPKPSRKYVMNFRLSLVSLESAAACASPVLTSALAGSSGLISLRQRGRRDAVLGLDGDAVVLALLVEQRLRRREVEDGQRGAAERVDRAVTWRRR